MTSYSVLGASKLSILLLHKACQTRKTLEIQRFFQGMGQGRRRRDSFVPLWEHNARAGLRALILR
jgi:hypothetical protein